MKQPENKKSVTRSATSPDQKDRGLGFNGQDNADRIQTKTSKYAGNYHGGAAEGNFGRAAANLKGNTGATANRGPKQPPTSSVPAWERVLGDGDRINIGRQERTPGGTRPFAPSRTENYTGDIDRMNFGRGPTKGNAQ